MKRVAFSQTIRTLCLLSLAGLAVFLSSPKLHAADELLKKKTKPQPTETETPDIPKENKLKLPETKLDLPDPDKLTKAKPGNQLPVEPIIKEMQRASKLISEQKTGKETQQIQREVVRNLEELIQLIESSPGKTIQRMSSGNESESPQQSEQKQTQKDQQGKNQQKGEQLSQGPAKKSTDRQNQGKATSGQLADRNAYVKDAWGHLPPAMRQQLLNIYTEKFLPRYEDQVKRYYEALAEKNRQQR